MTGAEQRKRRAAEELDKAIEQKTLFMVPMQPIAAGADGTVVLRYSHAPPSLQQYFSEQFLFIDRDQLLNSTAPLALTRA